MNAVTALTTVSSQVQHQQVGAAPQTVVLGQHRSATITELIIGAAITLGAGNTVGKSQRRGNHQGRFINFLTAYTRQQTTILPGLLGDAPIALVAARKRTDRNIVPRTLFTRTRRPQM